MSSGIETRLPDSSVGYIVRLNKGYWERLTTLIVSRNSVFGSNMVQDALGAALAKFLESEPESPLRTQQQLGAAPASDQRCDRRPRTRRPGLRRTRGSHQRTACRTASCFHRTGLPQGYELTTTCPRRPFLFFRLCQRPRSMPRGPLAAGTGGAFRWTPAMAIASGTHGRYHPRLA